MADERNKPGDDDPEAPPTEEELREAAALRDALEQKPIRPSSGSFPASANAKGSVELVRALRAAWEPDALESGEHAAIVDDVPSDPELALAEELRDSLDDVRRPAPALVGVLRAAWAPSEIDAEGHRAILAQALAVAPSEARAPEATPTKVVSLAERLRNRRARVVAGATTVLALAASVVVWISSVSSRPEDLALAPDLAKARSTQSLFDEPFRSGETSARIDRIALARAGDYRDNRFAKWGLK